MHERLLPRTDGLEVIHSIGTPGTEYVIDPDTLRGKPVDASAMAAYATRREHEVFSMADTGKATVIASETAMLFVMLGELDRAQRLIDFALERQAPEVDPRARAITEIRAGQVLQTQRCLIDAREHMQAVVQRCRDDVALATLLDFALQHLGKIRFDEGAYAEAQACLGEALALRERKGNPELIASTRQAINAVYRRCCADAG